MYSNYSRVKTYFDTIPRKSLEEIAREFRSGVVVKKNVVRALREIRVVTENVRGRGEDGDISEKLRNTGMLLITIPEPLQVSSVAGMLLCGASLILKGIEGRMLGIRDVVNTYRRVAIEIRQLLKEQEP
ncbi:MAG: hypothetical protein J7J11_02925 [Desulfurococcales archaeon]|nr:hypothetical protein [Desulfurococcales archaeon]